MESLLKEVRTHYLKMKGLDIKIENLRSELKVLRETTSTCCVHCKKVEAVQDKLKELTNVQVSGTAKVEKELDLVDKGMDRLFNRTNDLQKGSILICVSFFI